MTDKFDALSRTLAENKSRRGLFGLLGASAIAGPVALLAVEDAAAKRKKKKRCAKLGASCGAKKKCCGGELVSICAPLLNVCVTA